MNKAISTFYLNQTISNNRLSNLNVTGEMVQRFIEIKMFNNDLTAEQLLSLLVNSTENTKGYEGFI